MEIIETAEFEKALGALSQDLQRQYRRQKERFAEDDRDPRLHLKKVLGLYSIFSFRVTRRYRVLFYFRGALTVVFFEIDHRKDVYR